MTPRQMYEYAARGPQVRVRRIVEGAVADLGAAYSEELARDVARGSVSPLFDLPEWAQFGNAIRSIYGAPLVDAARRANRVADPAVDEALLIGGVIPSLIWRRDTQGSLIIETTRRGIVTIGEALRNGTNARRGTAANNASRTAYRMISRGMVGLDMPSMSALLRFGTDALGKGETYIRRLGQRFGIGRAERALNIARFETHGTISRALEEAWLIGVETGALGPGWGLRWDVTSANPCPRCLALNGTIRPLTRGGGFQGDTVGKGAGKFTGTAERIERPPLHNRCQCVLRRVRI